MAKVIKCPTCAENNPADQEFCQYCQARLQPLTGNLKGEDKPLTPGQIPTKKITADLEPVLPQWLRDARSSARQNTEEDAAQPPQPPRSTFSSSDLLAGLSAQRQTDDEEEDTPDWLANITGETPKPKKAKTESSDVRWVELGDTKDFARTEPEPEVPSWLSGTSQPNTQADEKDDLADWMRDAAAPPKAQQPPQPFSFDNSNTTSDAGETPDWLRSMVSGEGGTGFNDSENTVEDSFTSSDTPDWLRAMDAESAAPKTGSTSDSSDTPDWLRAMDAESAAPQVGSTSGSSDTPDWLRAMGAESVAPKADAISNNSDLSAWLTSIDDQDKTQSADSAAFSESSLGADARLASASDTPDWLKGLDSGTSSSDQDWLKDLQPNEGEQDSTPAWLSADVPDPVERSVQEQPPAKAGADLDIPSWLKASAPQSSIFDQPSVEQEAPAFASASSDTPDWLNTFKSVDEPEPQADPAFSMDKPAEPVVPPAFMGNASSSAGDNADSLFTEMPDWLSVVDETVSPESMPAAITNVDAIAPGDLPSWVQAMRPVDAGVPQISTSLSGDKAMEARGALAGLQGVLPAGTSFNPTSKPKAYSIKLQASDEQQAHAALLEQILSAETAPVPLDSFATIGTSRGLRWLLFFLLPVLLTVVLSMRTQIFALPNSMMVPLEFGGALQAAQSIPEGAPVLVVFDYESARVGEIEAAAVPMFDQMMLLRHPRLTFISTNETGAILAERFISSGTLATHNYQSGNQYVNLGYLPGGQMGIRAFAENPSVTSPYTIPQSSNLFDLNPTLAWTLPPLDGVTSLSQFAAWILITDDADSARTWIEQTASVRGSVPFVVVSSAQAAPMIQPYYSSQQITGLVSGLYGGALFEQNNSGRPGTIRAYWDAYSIGMLLAMALILGGGLLNLALGLRDRAAAREAK